MHRGVQSAYLFHQGFVNRQPTGRVYQQHIKVMVARIVKRGQGNLHRFLRRVAGKPFGACLRRHTFQLLDGRRAVNVRRHRQDFFLAFGDQVLGQLGRGGGFTGALQTRHEDDRRGLRRQIDVRHALAHGGAEFALHDADQHLPRRQ